MCPRGDYNQECGAGVGVVTSRMFLSGVGVGFLTTLGVKLESEFFVRLRLRVPYWIILHTLKLGIPVEMVQFLLKLLLK